MVNKVTVDEIRYLTLKSKSEKLKSRRKYGEKFLCVFLEKVHNLEIYKFASSSTSSITRVSIMTWISVKKIGILAIKLGNAELVKIHVK